MDAPRHVFTVDLEDWYHGLEIDPREWPGFAPRIERGLNVLLDLCEERGVRATFFVLGRQAEQTPEIVRHVAARGHEMACHGYSHRFVYTQTPRQFQDDVRRAKAALEDITGAAVLGFRAPFFSITESCAWALDVLVEEGFAYDSSLFPALNYRYGWRSAARWPGPIRTPAGATIFELPVSTLRIPHATLPGINVPVTGGGYFRLYPYWMTRWLTRRLERDGMGLVFYAHPWEFDPDHPRVRLSCRIAQFTHYVNLGTMRARTRRLLDDFAFVPIWEAYGDRFRGEPPNLRTSPGGPPVSTAALARAAPRAAPA